MGFLPLGQLSARQLVITIGVGILGITLGIVLSPLALGTGVQSGAFPWGSILGLTGTIAGIGGLVYGLKSTENSEKLSQEVGYVYQRLSAMEKYQSEQHSALQATIQGSLHDFLQSNQSHAGVNIELISEINAQVQNCVHESLKKSLPENALTALQNGLSDLTSEMGMVATLVQDVAISVGEHEQSLHKLSHHYGELTDQVTGQVNALQVLTHEVETRSAESAKIHARPHDENEQDDLYAQLVSPTVHILQRGLESAPQEILQNPRLKLQEYITLETPLIVDQPVKIAEPPSAAGLSLEEIVREQVEKMLSLKKEVQPVAKTAIERALSAQQVEDQTPFGENIAPKQHAPSPIQINNGAQNVSQDSAPVHTHNHIPQTVIAGSQLELLAREALKAAQERINQEQLLQKAKEKAEQLEQIKLAEKIKAQEKIKSQEYAVIRAAQSQPAINQQMSSAAAVAQLKNQKIERNDFVKGVEHHVEPAVFAEQNVNSIHNPAPVVYAPAKIKNDEQKPSNHNLVEIPTTAQREAIAAALREDKIELHLQPVMHLPQRKAYFYETLTRLRINDDLVLPSQFLPVVSEKGDAASFDTRVAERVMVVARHLVARGSDALISMNISAETLADGEYLKSLDRLIAENGTVRNRIVLEVGQGTIRSLSAERLIALKGLSHRGIKLCIDRVNDARIDAQTLAQIGISFVKIPVAFLIGREPSGFEIAPQDLPALFKRSGIELIAERVETEEQVRELIDLDVTLAQGHVFAHAKPVRSDVFTTQFAPKQRAEEKSQLETALDTALSDSERQSLRTFLSRSGK